MNICPINVCSTQTNVAKHIQDTLITSYICKCTVLSRNNLTLRLRFGRGSSAVRLRFVCGSVAVLLRSTDKNRKRPQEKITQLVYDAYRSFPIGNALVMKVITSESRYISKVRDKCLTHN